MEVRLEQHGDQSATVVIGPLTVLFSYSTPVAFYLFETGWIVSENVWSVTTGKHLNRHAPTDAPRLPNEEFRAAMQRALDGLVFRDG